MNFFCIQSITFHVSYKKNQTLKSPFYLHPFSSTLYNSSNFDFAIKNASITKEDMWMPGLFLDDKKLCFDTRSLNFLPLVFSLML